MSVHSYPCVKTNSMVNMKWAGFSQLLFNWQHNSQIWQPNFCFIYNLAAIFIIIFQSNYQRGSNNQATPNKSHIRDQTNKNKLWLSWVKLCLTIALLLVSTDFMPHQTQICSRSNIACVISARWDECGKMFTNPIGSVKNYEYSYHTKQEFLSSG